MDKKYNKYIEEIKNNNPVLDEPEKLTESILQQVQSIPSSKKKLRHSRIILPLLGIAAAILTGLFIVQFNEPVRQYTNPTTNLALPDGTMGLYEDPSSALADDALKAKIEFCMQKKSNGISRQCILSTIAEYSMNHLKKNAAIEKKIQLYIQTH